MPIQNSTSADFAATAPQLKAVKEPRPVEDALAELGDTQLRSADLVGMLESRLAAALRPPLPESPCRDPGPGYACQLHEHALDAVTRQQRLNDRLQELIDRVAI